MNCDALIFGLEPFPTLGRDCAHVWRIDVTAMENIEALTESLSPEDHARAAQFHFERDRRSFIVCRGALRQLIASYMNEDAAKIRLAYGRQGKPFLEHTDRSDLRFNVSHSGGLALIAFSRNQEIGVDIEFKRAGLDLIALADSSFSKQESAQVRACAPADRAGLFYEFWTCKEACIKADGRGLSIPLDQFSVVARSAAPQWREIVFAGAELSRSGMLCRVLEAGSGYAAAVAGIAESWQVLQMDMNLTWPAPALMAASHEERGDR